MNRQENKGCFADHAGFAQTQVDDVSALRVVFLNEAAQRSRHSILFQVFIFDLHRNEFSTAFDLTRI